MENFRIFGFVCLYFIVTYGLVVIVIYLVSKINKDNIPISQVFYLLLIGIIIGIIFGILEQFDFGKQHKYYRAAILGIPLAFGCARLVFRESSMQAAKGVVSSTFPQMDKDLENEIEKL